MKHDNELRDRTKRFALRIIHVVSALPRTMIADVIGKQLLRSGTSVGAQFREAYRAKSKADYVSKLTGSLQELDETQYWLELLVESRLVEEARLSPLIDESNQLLAILTTIVRKTKETE